jgi:hypothetical protein
MPRSSPMLRSSVRTSRLPSDDFSRQNSVDSEEQRLFHHWRKDQAGTTAQESRRAAPPFLRTQGAYRQVTGASYVLYALHRGQLLGTTVSRVLIQPWISWFHFRCYG